MKTVRIHLLLIVIFILLGCRIFSSPGANDNQDVTEDLTDPTSAEPTAHLPMITSEPGSSVDQGERIEPEDLAYLGAFRLPDGPPEIGWYWGGTAMTYYPEGDPHGPDDGFPGSLFGTGHEWNQYVSEISIPVPVNSQNLDDLPIAETLQEFSNIYNDLFDYLELPRVGLAYLPAQGSQQNGKLYFARAPHLDETATNPSHGWSELDLANPQSAGLWRIDEYWNYVTGDFLFEIPSVWADAYVPGRYLATGRYRDGGQAY